MKIAPVAEVKNKLSAYLDACRETPVVITRNGHPVAMLVPIIDEDDLETELLMRTPRFLQMLEQNYQSVQSDGTLSLAEMREQFGSAPGT